MPLSLTLGRLRWDGQIQGQLGLCRKNSLQKERWEEEEEEEEDLWVTKSSQGKPPSLLHSLCSPLYKLHTMSHERVSSCVLLFEEHKGDQPWHVLCSDSLELGPHCMLRRPGWRFQMCHEVSQPNSSCGNLKTHYKNSPDWGSLTCDKGCLAWNRGKKAAVFLSLPPLTFTVPWMGWVCFNIMF